MIADTEYACFLYRRTDSLDVEIAASGFTKDVAEPFDLVSFCICFHIQFYVDV